MLFTFTGKGETIMVRAADMQEAWKRQVETALVAWKASQACAGDGDAVVAVDPTDELLLGWFA
ncbi:hypothetical protein D9M71_663430 [compost metagenome]